MIPLLLLSDGKTCYAETLFKKRIVFMNLLLTQLVKKFLIV